MRRLELVLALCVGATLCVSACSGKDSTYRMTAPMDAAQVVSPSGAASADSGDLAAAKGTFTASISPGGNKLAWKVSYQDLGDPKLLIVDIHLGKVGEFGQLLVRLCETCKADADEGTVALDDASVKAIVEGNTWVTVVTDGFPNGLIRGQISTAA
jgi:hypothetical protein